MIRRDTAVRERTVASRGFLVDVIRTSGVIRSGERSGRPCEAQEGAAEGRQEGRKRGTISGYLKNAASRSGNLVLHLVLRTPIVPIPKKTEGRLEKKGDRGSEN